MLKRLARYSLLILTLLLAGVWADGYWHDRGAWFFGESFSLAGRSNCGTLHFGWTHGPYPNPRPPRGFRYHAGPADPIHVPTQDLVTWQGFGVIVAKAGQLNGRWIVVPAWMLFTPLLLATLALWYRPIRNRLQKRTSQGFEVQTTASEPQPVNERQDAKSAEKMQRV